MEIQVEENMQRIRLVCRGNATVEASAELRESLIDAFQKSKSVVLAVGGIGKVDISFLQLLIAAEKTAQENKMSIEIDPATYSQPLFNAAGKSGFCREQEHLGDESMHSILSNYNNRVRQEAGDV